MSSSSEKNRCEQTDWVACYALAALERSEAELMQTHLPTCAECQQEYEALHSLTDALTAWRAQVLPASTALWSRLADRVARQPRKQVVVAPAHAWHGWPEPRWHDVVRGISCKLLSHDEQMDRVSMLVRLSPGTAYPPHRHGSVEELYLLEGELWIEDRKLCPGDYKRAEPGTSDHRVWSATGCMCLLITSTSDQLR